MAINTNNHGMVIGRLTQDPAVFPNKDGSCKVKFTVAARDNFKSGAEKENKSQFVPVEAYVKDYSKSVFAMIRKGDKVSVMYSVRTNNYVKNGETIYGFVLFVEALQFEESKTVTDARHASLGAQAPVYGQVPAAPVYQAAPAAPAMYTAEQVAAMMQTMQAAQAPVMPAAPVYTQTAGTAIFDEDSDDSDDTGLAF